MNEDEIIEPKPETSAAAFALIDSIKTLPCLDGSVDVHWKTPGFELLVNVKPDGSVSFYGDDYGSQQIKGGWKP